MLGKYGSRDLGFRKLIPCLGRSELSFVCKCVNIGCRRCGPRCMSSLSRRRLGIVLGSPNSTPVIQTPGILKRCIRHHCVRRSLIALGRRRILQERGGEVQDARFRLRRTSTAYLMLRRPLAPQDPAMANKVVDLAILRSAFLKWRTIPSYCPHKPKS